MLGRGIITIGLLTIALINTSEAALDKEFCGDRYCGQISATKSVNRTVRKSAKIATHKEIRQAPVQVASLGETPTHSEASEGLLQIAKRYLGTNPTGWNRVWCGRFMAMIAPKAEKALKAMGLNPNWARDWAKLPGAKSVGKIGDIVVLTRGRGGHIGVLAGWKGSNPIIVSGNHNRVVGTGVYSKHRVLAYVSL